VIARLVAPAPAGRLDTVRVLTIGYALVWVVIRLDHWRDLAELPRSQWKPVAFAEWIGPFGAPAVTGLAILTLAAGAVAVTGRAWTVAAPAFAIGFAVLTAFGASWGAILHTEQLVVLHLLVLATGPSGRGTSATAGWPLRVMSVVTVATYFVAGVAKLRFGGGIGWLDGERLLLLVAHDNLRKRLLGDPSSPFAEHLVGHPVLFQLAAILTVVVELGAPLALLHRFRYPWIAMAWTFHVGVLAAMAILFPYPLTGVAFASMLPVERLRSWARLRAERGRPQSASTHPGAPPLPPRPVDPAPAGRPGSG
jgi:hypothetical protein